MIFHPRIKSLIQYIECDLSQKKSFNMSRHLNKCRKCQVKARAIREMACVLRSEKDIPRSARKTLMSNLPDLKRKRKPAFGEFTVVKGSVFVRKQKGGEEPAFPRMGLRKGDVVKIAEDGLALIRLKDGSEIYLNKKTEIHIKEGEVVMNLRIGKLFAMMKAQARKFRIRTPEALVEVLGTDFETESTPDRRTSLKVLKGEVSYANNTGKIIVKRKQQVEAGKSMYPRAKRLNKSGKIISWIKPLQGDGKTTDARFKNGLNALAFLLVMALGIFYLTAHFGKELSSPSQGKPGGENSQAAVSPIDARETADFNAVFKQPGEKWKCRISENAFIQNEWKEISKINISSEVLRYNKTDGATILVFVEDYWLMEELPDGDSVDDLIGASFLYHYSPDGKLKSFDIQGREKVPPLLAPIMELATFSNVMMCVYNHEKANPAEKWDYSFNVEIPGYPESYWKSKSIVEFSGYENIDKKRTAVFTAHTEENLGGFYSHEVRDPKVRSLSFLENRNQSYDKKFYMDSESGLIYKVVSDIIQGEISSVTYIYGAGRKEPVVRRETRNNQLSIKRVVTVDYQE